MTTAGEVKKCTGCDETKPLDEFSPMKGGKHGRASRCKACMRDYQRARYAAKTAAPTVAPIKPEPSGSEETMPCRTLDLSKPLQTRDGCPVRILCSDLKDHDFSIVAACLMKNGYEHVAQYTADGLVRMDGKPTCRDLINGPVKSRGVVLFAKGAKGQSVIRGPFANDDEAHKFAQAEKLEVLECRLQEWEA